MYKLGIINTGLTYLCFYNRRIYGEDLASKINLSPPPPLWFLRLLSILSLKGDSSAVVYSLVVVAPIICGGLVFGFSFVIQSFLSFLVLESSAGEERAGCVNFVVF